MTYIWKYVALIINLYRFQPQNDIIDYLFSFFIFIHLFYLKVGIFYCSHVHPCFHCNYGLINMIDETIEVLLISVGLRLLVSSIAIFRRGFFMSLRIYCGLLTVTLFCLIPDLLTNEKSIFSSKTQFLICPKHWPTY